MKIQIQKVWPTQMKTVNNKQMSIQNIDAIGDGFKQIRISAWNKQQDFAEFANKIVEVEGLKFTSEYEGKSQYKLEDKYTIHELGKEPQKKQEPKPETSFSKPEEKQDVDQLDEIRKALARMKEWPLTEDNKVKIAITISISAKKR